MNIYINNIKFTLRKNKMNSTISLYKNNLFLDYWSLAKGREF